MISPAACGCQNSDAHGGMLEYEVDIPDMDAAILLDSWLADYVAARAPRDLNAVRRHHPSGPVGTNRAPAADPCSFQIHEAFLQSPRSHGCRGGCSVSQAAVVSWIHGIPVVTAPAWALGSGPHRRAGVGRGEGLQRTPTGL